MVRTIAKMTYHIPVFGWMLKEAVKGSDTAKILFIVNMLAIWMLAIWLLAIFFFGYPAIILPALAAVLAMFVVLIAIMMG